MALIFAVNPFTRETPVTSLLWKWPAKTPVTSLLWKSKGCGLSPQGYAPWTPLTRLRRVRYEPALRAGSWFAPRASPRLARVGSLAAVPRAHTRHGCGRAQRRRRHFACPIKQNFRYSSGTSRRGAACRVGNVAWPKSQRVAPGRKRRGAFDFQNNLLCIRVQKQIVTRATPASRRAGLDPAWAC
jgi:hypothetical protein